MFIVRASDIITSEKKEIPMFGNGLSGGWGTAVLAGGSVGSRTLGNFCKQNKRIVHQLHDLKGKLRAERMDLNL